MSLVTILILGFGLSMDAFAVSVCKGMALKDIRWKNMLTAGLWFGIFQGLMPAIGYIAGSLFAQYIELFASWIAFGLLALIGINMIREAGEEESTDASMGLKEMFVLAIATSIDALAVGITFSAVPVEMFAGMSRFANTMLACLVICMETFVLSAVGIKVGSVFQDKFGKKAQITGGVILILIGVRILLGHYGIL